MNNEILKEIPNNTTIPEIKYSKVVCSICGKFLYYGGTKDVVKYKNPKFSCKCFPQKAVNGVCANCHKPIKYDAIYEKSQWLRCCCGHAEFIPKEKIDEVTVL